MVLTGGYFVGSMILGVVFLLLYCLRKDLRKEMVFGALMASPYALTAPFFIPEYWDPPYLWGSIGGWKLGVEDVLFCFFVGGITAVVYEVVMRKKEVKIGKKNQVRSWWPYIVGTGTFLLLEHLFPAWSILSLAGVLLLVAFLDWWGRRDLIQQSVFAGGSFAILYFFLFKVFDTIYPTYIAQVYQHQNLLGVYLSGIPLEELLFAFSIGAAWSVGYEYILGYRTK